MIRPILAWWRMRDNVLLVMGGGDGSDAVVIYAERSPSQLGTCNCLTVPATSSCTFAAKTVISCSDDICLMPTDD